jgi:hypothetical protein
MALSLFWREGNGLFQAEAFGISVPPASGRRGS